MTSTVHATASVREVEIAGLSPRAELVSVLRVAAAVVFAVWLYLANQASVSDADRSGPQKNLLPFQSLVEEAGVDDQRMFRALQVALLEAENARTTPAAWPTPQAMAEQGIEPFAVDPTNKGARYTWQLRRDGIYLNYLGVPDRAGAPAWLLLIVEPDPSAPPEIYQNDEEHARLVDGTILHVSIWRHAQGAGVSPGLARVPQAEGWTQLFASGPSAVR